MFTRFVSARPQWLANPPPMSIAEIVLIEPERVMVPLSALYRGNDLDQLAGR